MSSTTADLLGNLVQNILVATEALQKFQTVAGVTNTEVTAMATTIKTVRGGTANSTNGTNGNTTGVWAYQNLYSNAMSFCL